MAAGLVISTALRGKGGGVLNYTGREIREMGTAVLRPVCSPYLLACLGVDWVSSLVSNTYLANGVFILAEGVAMAGSGMEGQMYCTTALVFLRFVSKKENRQCWMNVVTQPLPLFFVGYLRFQVQFFFFGVRGAVDALKLPFLLSQNTQTSVKSQFIQPPLHIHIKESREEPQATTH